MQLSAGTRLGPYEVVSLLGAGGMGEVYRARDWWLNRDVAAKAPVARFGITLPSDRPLAVETAAAARQAARPSVVVVQNWFEELNAKLPATP